MTLSPGQFDAPPPSSGRRPGEPASDIPEIREERRAQYPAATLEDVKRPAFTSFLDLARWTAAGLVFVGHLRDPLLLGYTDLRPSDRTAWVKVWYFVTGLHAEAVVVFFVLSGFLVGGLASGKIQAGRFAPKIYGVDRATRILLPFIPALLLTVVLDFIGSHAFPGAGLYDHTQAMIREKLPTMAPFTSFMTPGTFGINLLLLQTFFGPAYGSNQPLWTISAEFWFYVVFGFFAFGIMRPRTVSGIVSFGLAVVVIAALGVAFIQLLILWAVGLLAAFVPRGRHETPILAALLFAVLLAVVRLKQDLFDVDSASRTLKNVVVAASFAWLLIGMRHKTIGFLTRTGPFNRRMADFSYSLYLIHFPMMFFLLSALYASGLVPGIARGYAPTNAVGLGLYAGIIVAVYAAAWLFAQATERNTGRLRAAAMRLISRQPVR